ncbi:GntR family transcriptional regulator [Cytobacillus kochii]|uniref:GntR family transcriptional regulator n=1 Tax=Cytobacillus kochii TaxID=859143 RepID=UPI001CD36C20|nr:GntR family transcriptional regulator [Cytobacillus kochii]MCA1025922.1 GntR family transcriptional regulator [Cytobacillus kochii]MCM3321484.1 GntR family transcriptional regulator [Cytobacillus kochii]MCM3343682.1 GntR family transcriptional regulator [Cytobacillus kochii]MDM5207513.1 GntR family transcriptional regulator [Cytobacillus kochii]
MTIDVDLKLDNRDTLHLKVCNVLREAIIKGQFKPGERLKQSDLAEKLGVSRMPIREALRKLESEGLITLVPHKGAIVKTIHLSDLQEVYTLRAQLEKMAFIQSAKLLTDTEITRLIDLVHLMEDSEDVDEFVERNIEFHQLLLKHCHWERLNGFIDSLWNGLPQQTPHFITGQTATSNEEHQEIIKAIREKRFEHAGEILSHHILRTGESLIHSLKNERMK